MKNCSHNLKMKPRENTLEPEIIVHFFCSYINKFQRKKTVIALPPPSLLISEEYKAALGLYNSIEKGTGTHYKSLL